MVNRQGARCFCSEHFRLLAFSTKQRCFLSDTLFSVLGLNKKTHIFHRFLSSERLLRFENGDKLLNHLVSHKYAKLDKLENIHFASGRCIITIPFQSCSFAHSLHHRDNQPVVSTDGNDGKTSSEENGYVIPALVSYSARPLALFAKGSGITGW